MWSSRASTTSAQIRSPEVNHLISSSLSKIQLLSNPNVLKPVSTECVQKGGGARRQQNK